SSQEVAVEPDLGIRGSEALRGERAPLPPGVGIGEDGDPQGLRSTCWHAEDARKPFRGSAQPEYNKRLTAHRRMANRAVRAREKSPVHSFATCRSPSIKQAVKTNDGLPPNVPDVVKLSVIVPFYNVQQYASDTLRSLQANARDDFEFILVDDCSR